MSTKRAFISFDFDHDEDLRNLLVGQAKNPDSSFTISNWSLKGVFDRQLEREGSTTYTQNRPYYRDLRGTHTYGNWCSGRSNNHSRGR